MARVKIEVGQVWTRSKYCGTLRITRIDNENNSYCCEVVKNNGETLFAQLDENHIYDLKGWTLQSVSHEHYFQAMKNNQCYPTKTFGSDKEQEMAFFKATGMGQCPCGMIRSQCSYHKVSS